jgi:integrase
MVETKKTAKRQKRRKRGEGSVFQRHDGLWVGVLHVGYRDGRRQRKTVYGKTAEEAAAKLRKEQANRDNGLPIITGRQTVKQFLLDWLENSAKPSLRHKSFVSYKQLLTKHVIPVLGHRDLTKLTPQEVQAMLNAIHAGELSPRTVQYVRAVLRRALNYALKWGLVVRNVAALTDAPRVVRKEVKPFTIAEIPTLLRAFENERLGPLYLLALSHGLRQGEALGLQWSELDLNGKFLRVKQALQWVQKEARFVEPKTKQSNRQIALSERVIKALKKHRKQQLEDRLRAGGDWVENGLVFTTRSGRPLDGVNVTRDFKRMLKNWGLPVRRFHDLRHTTASLLLHQNVHMRVVMDLLGHSEIRVTMDLYSHVGSELQREAARQMDSLLKSARSRNK